MFDILKTAKITVADFAKVAGVSRVSVSHWVNGKMKPHKLHQAKINLLIAAVNRAVDAQELPIPQSMERTTGFKRLKALILQHALEIRKSKTEE